MDFESLEEKRTGLWQSGYVTKYLKLLMGLCLAFSVIMFVLGMVTLIKVGVEPASVGIAIFGVLAVALTWFGARTERYLLGAAGALATGLIIPTTWGIAPMIIGFILFILVVSLQLFITTFEEE